MNKHFIIIIILLLVLTGCGGRKSPVPNRVSGDYSIETMKLRSSTKDKENWTFEGKDIVVNGQKMTGHDVKVLFPMEAEGVMSTITGDSGTLVMDETMILSGDVIYLDVKRKIRCSRLRYTIPSDEIEIPGEFVFYDLETKRTTEGFHLTSKNNLVKIYIERIDKMSLEVDNSEFFK